MRLHQEREQSDRDTQREDGHVKMEAALGVKLPWIQERPRTDGSHEKLGEDVAQTLTQSPRTS